ncbi:MAG TPA: class I SAM-dependent methyltransferase [Methylomirabilota bacterium]|nr:class I SAM-dependent methyltransferase [Methylomirabilota bacterium]
MPGSSRPRPTAPSPAEPGAGLSPAFRALLDAEPLADRVVLDVGTGGGRLALYLAPRCRRVVGIDVDAGALAEARRRAAAAGLANVEFVQADADAEEYGAFAPDAVVAHLCFSDAIAERAGRALQPGQPLVFVAFHADQWRETGRRSRFAYDEAQLARVLAAAGFRVEHLQVEREVQRFGSLEEALAAAVGLQEKWKADGRWFRYIQFLEEGGRTLTRSHLVVKARRA